MMACLNPHGGHSARSAAQRQIVCSTPGCGFLLEEAPIGSWRVASLLKQGPAADLYLAVQATAPSTSRLKMLVKVLRVPIIQPISRAESVLNQLVTLRHPHIHSLQGRGWTFSGGALYLLSTYEAQGSLQYQPLARQQVALSAVTAIVRQIAEALQYAHERQMVHGRLKLENCLMAAPGTVQVSDFYRQLFAHEDFTTSPYYVAPEQFLNQAVPASDQYALAIIAYQLLTGHFPFPETEPLAVMAQQLRRDPMPVSAFRSDLPRNVDVTLNRALNKHPPERFPTILIFAEALQQSLESGPRITGTLNYPQRRDVPQQLPEMRMRAPQVMRVPTPPPGGATPLCLLPGHTAEATVLRWASDGIHLASAGPDQTVRIWRIQKHIGTPLAVLEGHSDRILALSWSPDGSLLASAAADATLRIWNVSHIIHQAGGSLGKAYNAQAAWWGHDGAALALDWSPDGAYLASGGADRSIRLWDTAGKPQGAWQAHGRGGITALAWSAEGNLLASGGFDHQVMLWNPVARASLLTCAGHQSEIRHLAWSADGGLIAASAGKKDSRIRVWNAQTGQQKAMAGGNTREVVGLFWPPDSSWLAAASADRRMDFWNIDQPVGQLLGQPVELPSTPLSMAGAPHSGLIALGLADMMIMVLRLTA